MTRLQFAKYVEPVFVPLFLVALSFLAFEAYWLDNTIYGLRLFWLSFSVGCLSGFLPAAIFGFFHNDLLSGLSGPLTRTLKFAFFSALCFGLLFPANASFINRKFIVSPAHQIKVIVTGKGLGGKSKTTPYVFFSPSPDVTERIEVDRQFFNGISAGQGMSLTLERGFFGYDVVRFWCSA